MLGVLVFLPRSWIFFIYRQDLEFFLAFLDSERRPIRNIFGFWPGLSKFHKYVLLIPGSV